MPMQFKNYHILWWNETHFRFVQSPNKVSCIFLDIDIIVEDFCKIKNGFRHCSFNFAKKCEQSHSIANTRFIVWLEGIY